MLYCRQFSITSDVVLVTSMRSLTPASRQTTILEIQSKAVSDVHVSFAYRIAPWGLM